MSASMCTSLIEEVISSYYGNCTSVYCTLPDANEAFDPVNYDKLFELLIGRRLPSLISGFLF